MAKIFPYFEPILAYYGVIYGITKILEFALGSEKYFWESVWHEIMDICGENEAIYLQFMITGYTYILYWTGAIIFFTVEKIFRDFKTQKKIGEIGENGKFLEVSKFVKI